VKQALPELRRFVLYATLTDYLSIGSGQNASSSTFGAFVGATPLPQDATFRNIAIFCKDTRTAAITLTFRRNFVNTALSVTLPASQNYATTTGVAVACGELDYVDWVVSSSAGYTFPGITVAFAIEQEGARCFYSVPAIYGSVTAGDAALGGCFGNGGWQGPGGALPQYSGSASVCAIPGTITRIALADIGGVATGGSWTAYIKKNGVLQDGSGGTVNTAVTLLDTVPAKRVVGTIALPVVPGDICDVVYVRNGTSVSATLQVAVGIGFTPTDDGWFMLTGGDNVGLPSSGTTSYSFTAGSSDTDEGLQTVPIGPVGIVARGLYVIRGTLPGGSGPGSGNTYAHTLLKGTAEPYAAGSVTAAAVSMSNTTNNASITGLSVAFPAGSTAVIRNNPSASAGGDVMHWGLQATFPDVEEEESGNGIIGPLIWVVINRVRQPAGTSSADAFSDLEMQDPATYYGSYKQPFLLHAGDAERALSDPITGDVVSSTFRFILGDQDEDEDSSAGRLRAQLASEIDKYWTLPAWFFCTTRANRAELGLPFTAFAGRIVDVQPAFPRALEITLGDLLTERIVNDKLQIPWRLIRDGFLNQLDAVSEKLDLEQPEPIIYGEHNRTADGSPSTETGYRVEPIYLGVETVNSSEKHVWLIAGHACKDVRVFVDDVEQAEANGWLIPGEAGFTSAFGASYVDKASSTFGTTRRYTLLYGTFGGGSRPFGRFRTSNADACAVGDKTLTVAVQGIESVGDGSGTLITDYYDIYKHFTVNFLANAGPDSYQSGAWLDSPQWSNPNGTVIDVVHEASFDDCGDIAAQRIDGGLIGAVAIGLRAGDRSGPSRWIAEFNRNGFCQSGPVEPFQWGITTLHPTHAAKDAAVHYTDAYEVVEGSFSTAMEWDRHATHFPWRTDYEQTTGVWKSSGVVESAEVNYYEHKEASVREYLFVPGEQQGEHLATLEAGLLANPPRLIKFDAPIGPDAVDDSLAYRNPGDYITYEHFDAVTEQRAARLAYVQRVGVRGSARRAYVIALDVEDHINFDVGGSPAGSPQ
jgi:phage tail protein X